MPNEIPDIQWESLCHGCGKCCHSKYDLFVFAIADPVYVCKYLTSDNRCEIYEDRLNKNGCISLREAVKRTGLLPKSCGYIHLNPQHKELIFPKSEEEFWEFIDLADRLLKKTIKGQKINLVSFVRNRRGKSDEFKLLPKPDGFQSVFLNKKFNPYILSYTHQNKVLIVQITNIAFAKKKSILKIIYNLSSPKGLNKKFFSL